MLTPSLDWMLDLTSKTALITGASQGIGAATAQVLATAGADLVMISRHINVTATTRDYSATYGREPLVMQADVSDADAMHSVVEAAQARFGGIDVLVNNAAMDSNVPLVQAEDAEWLAVLQTNLIGVARLCKLVAPGMIAKKSGRIINIASNLGAFALHDKGVYSASKAALMQLTRNLALELAPHSILVNALAVGAIDTHFVDQPERDTSAIVKTILLGRMGTPAEIANVILFLASPMSSFITGQALFLDGGAGIWFSN